MKNKYTRDDCYKNLENINNWINNSDTKASIILGLFGVMLSVVFTNDNLLKLTGNLFVSVCKNVIFSDILYIIFISGSIVSIFIGLYKILKVLIPTLKTKKGINNSHSYFGSIANFDSFSEFKTSLKNTDEEDIIDDILNQIYINSIICANKFNNFKNGLKLLLLGLILLLMLYIIGLIIYL